MEPAQPPIQSVPKAKRPECEINHSPPSSIEVKNECNYNSTPIVCRRGLNRGNILFTSFELSAWKRAWYGQLALLATAVIKFRLVLAM